MKRQAPRPRRAVASARDRSKKSLFTTRISRLRATGLIVFAFAITVAAFAIGGGSKASLAVRALLATVNATDTASLAIDHNGNGHADPGDTIKYTVDVSSPNGDLTGVTYSDTLDPNVTLVPGSVGVSPIANDDSYNADSNGNLTIAAPGVLANDFAGSPAGSAALVGSSTTPNGGTVQLLPDGSFVYHNATGFTGVDTFRYSINGAVAAPSDNDNTASVRINVISATVPGAPINPTVTSGNAQVTVSFTPPASNGGSPVISYTATSNPGGITKSGASSPLVVTGLTNGQTYTFTVRAINSLGAGPPSPPSAPVTPSTVPGAPTIISATSGNAQAIVLFTPPASNGGSPVISYTATSSPGGFTKTGASSPLVVTGLTNGQTYTFTVRAINSLGQGPSSPPSAPVIPSTVPSAPTITSVTAGDGSANISFTPPASNGGSPVISYTATSSPGGFTKSGASSPLVVTGLTNGQTYSFTVRAVNLRGTSLPSAPSAPVLLPIIGTPTRVLTFRDNDVPFPGLINVRTGNVVNEDGSETSPYTGEQTAPPTDVPPEILELNPANLYLTFDPNRGVYMTFHYTSLDLSTGDESAEFGDIVNTVDLSTTRVYVITSQLTLVDILNDASTQLDPITLNQVSGDGYVPLPTPPVFQFGGQNFVTFLPRRYQNVPMLERVKPVRDSLAIGSSVGAAAAVEVSSTVNTSEKLVSFFANIWTGLSDAIIPTAQAAEREPLSGRGETIDSPNAICFDNDTDDTTCHGPGFTIPAGKHVLVTYQVVINQQPPNFATVSDQGTVSSVSGAFASTQTYDPNQGPGSPTVTQIQAAIDSTPALTLGISTVTVDEGQLAVNTGGFSDPVAGDAVTVTASAGTITQSSGTIQAVGEIDGVTHPVEMAFDKSFNLFVAEYDAHTLAKFDSSGNLVTRWTVDQNSNVTGVAVDSTGNVYVSAKDTDKIYVYTNDGTLLRILGGSGGGDGQLHGPHGIVIDKSDNLYVADLFNARVQELTTTGSFIRTWGTPGSGDGQFNQPQGIAQDSAGNIYVADRQNHRIQKFASTGTFLMKWSVAGENAGVGIDSQDHVFASNFGGTVEVFDSNGAPLYAFGGNGSGSGQLILPHGVEFDAKGNIWVADYANNRVQKFAIPNTWTWSLPTTDGPAQSQSVTITATDNHGLSSSKTFQLNVNNVAPTAGFTNDSPISFGSIATVSFSGQTDPSSVETAAGFHYAYNVDGSWISGDGTYAGSSGQTSATLSGLTTGTHTVKGRIIDKDQGFNDYQTEIIVSANAPVITWAKPADITYGTALGATQLNASANVPGSFTYTPAAGTVPGAGDGQTLHVEFTPADTANYSTVSKDVSINVAKAALTVKADDQHRAFGAANPMLTGTIEGLRNGDQITATYSTAADEHSNAGAYDIMPQAVDSTPSTLGNYTVAVVNGKLSVTQAAATIKVNAPTGIIYDANEHPASATVTGVFGEDLGAPAITYAPGGPSAPVNAGSYGVLASYAGNNNYQPASDNSATINISKAPSVTTVTCATGPFTYDGAPQMPCSATVAGSGLNQLVMVNYTNNVTTGIATATAAYGEDANHTGSSGASTFNIGKRSATWITIDAGKTFGSSDPNPLTTGSGNGFVDQVSASYTRVPGDAVAGGPYLISATLTSAPGVLDNYEITNNGASFRIIRATADCSSVTSYSVTFDGDEHTAIGTCKGVDGNVLDGLELGQTKHQNAGDYATDLWKFTDSTGNYNDSEGTLHDNIAKAPTTTSATCPGNVTYNGSAQNPCSASVTGAGGLNQTLDLNYTNNTNAGTATAAASFAGDDNHTGSHDSKNFTIARSDQSISFGAIDDSTFGTVSFGVNASASSGLTVSLTASGSCNLNSAASPANVSITGAGSCTISATQTGDNNYNAAGAVSRTFSIAKASQAITFGAISGKTFGDPDFGVSATGGNSGNPVTFAAAGNCIVLNGALHITGAGSCNVVASQAANNNYNPAPDVIQSFAIAKASSVTTVTCPAGVTYNGTGQTPCTATATGLGGLNQPLIVGYANNTGVGIASANGAFSGDANHTGSFGSSSFTIGKSPLTVAANSASRNYGATNPAFTGTLTGVAGNDNIAATYTSSATPGSSVGTYAITPVLSDPNNRLSNYQVTIQNGTLKIGISSAFYATSSACGAVTLSGNAFIDSFSSDGGYAATKTNSGGNISVNGGTTLSGNAAIYGTLATLHPTAGNCNQGNGITLNGHGSASGGYSMLTPITFVTPGPFTAGTSDVTLSGKASRTISPGNYRNITVSGSSTLTLTAGTYNINSIVLSGNSGLKISPTGSVVLNIVGSGVSKPVDFSGGSVGDPEGPANLLVNYGGTGVLSLTGGVNSYGVIYAPNAPVTLSGNGDWFGSMVVFTLNNSGNGAIHFDRQLGN